MSCQRPSFTHPPQAGGKAVTEVPPNCGQHGMEARKKATKNSLNFLGGRFEMFISVWGWGKGGGAVGFY